MPPPHIFLYTWVSSSRLVLHLKARDCGQVGARFTRDCGQVGVHFTRDCRQVGEHFTEISWFKARAMVNLTKIVI